MLLKTSVNFLILYPETFKNSLLFFKFKLTIIKFNNIKTKVNPKPTNKLFPTNIYK